MLENQPESSIYEAISLISIDDSCSDKESGWHDSSVKLKRNGEPNNLYLHLARGGHWQRKWITASFSVNQHLRQKSLNESLLSACLRITQWPVSTATVVHMMSRLSLSNWLVRLLSIGRQISLAMEQDSSLTQDKFEEVKRVNKIALKSFSKNLSLGVVFKL